MFKINDTVLYGLDGVCTITDITEKNFGNGSMKYYILKPIYSNQSTVFVPAGNEELTSKMRCVLTADEVHGLIETAAQDDCIWIDDENRRRETYKEIIGSGRRRSLMSLMKTLNLRRRELVARGKKLHLSDERFYKDAEKLICNEFAFVLKMNPEDIPEYITVRMQA